ALAERGVGGHPHAVTDDDGGGRVQADARLAIVDAVHVRRAHLDVAGEHAARADRDVGVAADDEDADRRRAVADRDGAAVPVDEDVALPGAPGADDDAGVVADEADAQVLQRRALADLDPVAVAAAVELESNE